MKKLRIGQISPLNLPVPPKKYGGAEKIIYSLCQELTKKGHQVFLFGTENSKVSCRVIPVLKKGLWETKPKDCMPYYMYQMAVIAKKTKELKLDILHDHLGPITLSLYGQINVPIIHTLHIPFFNPDRPWAYKKLKSKLVSISLDQRKPAPDLNYVDNIYNGIDINSYPFNPKPKNYFLWVGELSPRKGIYEVIKIAKKAKIKLILIGRIPPIQQYNDFSFFKKYIKKELNKNGILYLGEKTPEELKKYYKNAKGFLFPLQWEEPFGLTMIESMSCGTPVIVFKRGSVPEVVKDKKTGFVVNPLTEKGEVNLVGFIKAIKDIEKIKRKDCRLLVEENFTIQKMVNRYEKLFLKTLKK